MELIPITKSLKTRKDLMHEDNVALVINMAIEHIQRKGHTPPWHVYLASVHNDIIGSGGFKGPPVNGKVEIAYMIFDKFQNKGYATQLCRQLVALSLANDPSIEITARTLPKYNFSTRVLQKNDFILLGTVSDEEDGEVWEWRYTGTNF